MTSIGNGAFEYCEILTSVDGSGDNACANGGAGSSEFAEGASDTSTYPHYALANGGQRTHRRFDVVGPDSFGPDSTVSVRITHGDLSDVRILLHVPSTWEGHETENMTYGEFNSWCDERTTQGISCAPTQGIVLTPETAGSVDDATLTWRLGDICEFGDDAVRCTVGGFDESGALQTSEAELSPWANGGHVTTTFVDLGGDSSSELTNCSACTEGGGQANQWQISLR